MTPPLKNPGYAPAMHGNVLMTGKPQNIPESHSVNHFAQIPITFPWVPEGFLSYLFLIVCNEAGEKDFRSQGTVTLPLYANPIFSKGKSPKNEAWYIKRKNYYFLRLI